MLSRKIPRLRPRSSIGLKCKGNPNTKPSNSVTSSNKTFSIRSQRLGKYVLQGVPALSIFALLGMFLFETISLDASGVYANTYTATNTSGNSSIALTIGGAGEDDRVEAGYGSVTYRSHTVRVKADAVEDYGLTISGPTSLTAPAGGSTISGANDTTGDGMTDNTWGYGWGDTGTSDANLTYRTLSTTGTNILTVNNANDKPALTNRAVDFTKKLVFAVKFAEGAIPGRYYANVTLSLTATPAVLTKYSITYNANSGSNAPVAQIAESYDKSYTFTIASQGSMTRSGYNFLGWSENSTATTATYAAGSSKITLSSTSPSKTLYAVWKQNSYNYKVTYDCKSGTGCPSNLDANSTAASYSYTIPSTKPTRSGYKFLGYSTSSTASTADSNYSPGTSISLTSGNPTRALYAVWQQKLTSFPSTLTTMQGMTTDICDSVAVGVSKTLTDSRDNSTYTVTKLIDENCWMTQNLRIINKSISSTNSDMASGSFTIPASSKSGFSSYNTSNAYYSGNNIYGAYYSWYAATAGTGTNSMNSGDAASSICPKGWKLPKNGEYEVLSSNYTGSWTTNSGKKGKWIGASSASAGGAFFPAAGFYYNNSPYSVDSGGLYWSRSSYTANNAYSMSFESGNMFASGNYFKYYGFPVRCVAYSS